MFNINKIRKHQELEKQVEQGKNIFSSITDNELESFCIDVALHCQDDSFSINNYWTIRNTLLSSPRNIQEDVCRKCLLEQKKIRYIEDLNTIDISGKIIFDLNDEDAHMNILKAGDIRIIGNINLGMYSECITVPIEVDNEKITKQLKNKYNIILKDDYSFDIYYNTLNNSLDVRFIAYTNEYPIEISIEEKDKVLDKFKTYVEGYIKDNADKFQSLYIKYNLSSFEEFVKTLQDENEVLTDIMMDYIK